MQLEEIKISANFKKTTIRTILAIILFIIVYLTLVASALTLMVGCSYLGMMIIVAHPSLATVFLGVGVITLGLMVIIFLIKFIFKEHTTDLSHLVEITPEQEPKLFAFVNEIANEVQTPAPKKIYLSADVTAAVFYDSSFWSMFLPIKKNLQIGVGLVNCVTVEEFRAILAHEFGHFSQKSMKLGSYVYNVNQVIYNMLQENTSYIGLVEKLSSIHGAITLAVLAAVKIVQGIQWVLSKMYNIVNINYMALSREMEFHADQIAAYVAGSKPLIDSLLRLDLANRSYYTVLDYYEKKIRENIKTKDIYPQYQHVMHFLGKKNQLVIKNNLPQVSLEDLSRYNKSKLVIKDQWASHPSTKDRVLALEQLNIQSPKTQTSAAATLFRNVEKLHIAMTDKIFSTVQFEQKPTLGNKEEFIKHFNQYIAENSFDASYNSYYDDKNIQAFDIQSVLSKLEKYRHVTKEQLFGKNTVDTVYTNLALQNDINTLNAIDTQEITVKTFDYDGIKYSIKNIFDVILLLQNEQKELTEKIQENDKAIFAYYYFLAQKQGKEAELIAKYESLFQADSLCNTHRNIGFILQKWNINLRV